MRRARWRAQVAACRDPLASATHRGDPELRPGSQARRRPACPIRMPRDTRPPDGRAAVRCCPTARDAGSGPRATASRASSRSARSRAHAARGAPAGARGTGSPARCARAPRPQTSRRARRAPPETQPDRAIAGQRPGAAPRLALRRAARGSVGRRGPSRPWRARSPAWRSQQTAPADVRGPSLARSRPRRTRTPS
jgi:hypothetical protein